MQKSSIMLAVGLVIAVGAALVYGSRDHAQAVQDPPSTERAVANEPAAEPMDPEPELATTELPPGHPPIGNMGGNMGSMGNVAPSTDEAPALAWTAPPAWKLVPNPNGMRLATYELPRSGSDKETPELVVARAGGDVEGNVKRWAGQFDDSYSLKERHETVHGLKVTLVQIDGTYQGGMGSSGSHPGWTMLSAIVETSGSPYFFKITGPSGSVNASAKAFEAMIGGLTPR